MSSIQVIVKHAGKSYPADLDPTLPATNFKQSINALTGVPVDRMKVMSKGGLVKDDTEWSKYAPKPKQIFTVIGSAEALPKPPEKPVVFLEDMDDEALAGAMVMPVGLVNLGNTCYMNATVQAMRAWPELGGALHDYTGGLDNQTMIAGGLRDLYTDMGRTTSEIVPSSFLRILRQAVPQFNEMSRNSGGGGLLKMGTYAQQDADECYTEIVTHLKQVPAAPPPTREMFVAQYMTGEMTQTLKCIESDTEEPSISKEKILKVACNISITTNFMMSGIMDSLDESLTKQSPSLGREANYSKHSRLSRVPSCLCVHMVRFYWRRDINKKAKIMRKVKFPFELDILQLVTPELKAKMLPLNEKVKEVERGRVERRKVRARTKKPTPTAPVVQDGDVSMETPVVATLATTGATDIAQVPETVEGELEPEEVYLAKEKAELEAVVNPDLLADVGCAKSGVFDLAGIVTHKGASADSGHYIGYVRQDSITPDVDHGGKEPQWYKFDDEKVSSVTHEQIMALDGGGEDSVAYLLFYRERKMY